MSETPTDNSSENQPAAPTRSRHWQMLIISLGVICLSFLLQVVDEGKVAFRFLPTIALPESCLSRAWFSIECPGCGLTRSFIYLAEGQITRSLQMHRIGWVMAIAVLSQIPYRSVALYTRSNILSARLCKWFGNLLIAGLILNWLFNQMPAFR